MLSYCVPRTAVRLAVYYCLQLTSPTGAVAKYCDQHVCVSVCESVCPHTHTHDLYQIVGPPPASLKYVVSGFVDGIMFFNNGPYSSINFATYRFRLNLLIYRKVGQSSISYY